MVPVRTSSPAGPGSLRRGLLAFDIAGAVPAGSTIQAVELQLHCSREPFFEPPPATVTLHAALANWGEGTSDAGSPGGTGAPAAPGDATWIHTFFNTSLWANPGGDFAAVASGSVSVADTTFYVLGSTPQMVADVQSWLDNPATNYGWVVVGQEDAQNARRFDTRENSVTAFRPALTIQYESGTVAVETRTWAGVKGLYR